MMNMHTMPVCRMNLVTAVVVLLHRELVELIGEVVGGSGVHVPSRVDIVGGCLAMGSSRSDLTIHVATVIVNAEVIGFEPFEASRGDMTDLVTNLTDGTVASVTTIITLSWSAATRVVGNSVVRRTSRTSTRGCTKRRTPAGLLK